MYAEVCGCYSSKNITPNYIYLNNCISNYISSNIINNIISFYCPKNITPNYTYLNSYTSNYISSNDINDIIGFIHHWILHQITHI